MQGLTSNLYKTKCLSSGITKFIFKSLKLPSNGHRRATKTTRFWGSLKLFYVNETHRVVKTTAYSSHVVGVLRRNKFLFLKNSFLKRKARNQKTNPWDHAISFQNAQVKACIFHSLHLDWSCGRRVMVVLLQVCAITGCWQEGPLGYLGPCSALAIPLDSFLGPQ